MSNQAARHLQYETEFLSTVDSNLQAARGNLLVGSIWKTARQDEADRLRATMAKSGIFDREMLKALPANRRVSLHGYEKSWLFWKKPTGVAIASTLSPMTHYVDPKGDDAPPISLGELADHVRKLVSQPDVPHLIGVCSPSGFAAEAYDSKLDLPHVTLILIEPDSTGGWKVTPTADSMSISCAPSESTSAACRRRGSASRTSGHPELARVWRISTHMVSPSSDSTSISMPVAAPVLLAVAGRVSMPKCVTPSPSAPWPR